MVTLYTNEGSTTIRGLEGVLDPFTHKVTIMAIAPDLGKDATRHQFQSQIHLIDLWPKGPPHNRRTIIQYWNIRECPISGRSNLPGQYRRLMRHDCLIQSLYGPAISAYMYTTNTEKYIYSSSMDTIQYRRNPKKCIATEAMDTRASQVLGTLWP